MFDPTVAEAKELRRATGKSWSRIMEELGDQVCREHRLYLTNCKGCKASNTGVCATHREGLEECATCRDKRDLDETTVAGISWLMARRSKPDLTFEEHEQKNSYTQMVRQMGEAMSQPTATTSAGSPPSSTLTQASRRKRSGV